MAEQIFRGFPREVLGDGFEEKYMCNLCTLVLNEPVQAYCGHKFCKQCVEIGARSGDEIYCSRCEKEKESGEPDEYNSIINREQAFPDHAFRRDMAKLDSKCVNPGCSWTGLFKHYAEHARNCEREAINPDTDQMKNKLVVLENQVKEILAGLSANIERSVKSANEPWEIKIKTFEGIGNALKRDLEKTITAVEKLERHRRNQDFEIDQNRIEIRAIRQSFEARLEEMVRSIGPQSCNGTFIWKVSGFADKRQAAAAKRKTSVYSPPFYTSEHGYKMCMRLYPNGDGMGTDSHLSLFFVIMRGEYDALLKWPFSPRVTFTLIDQLKDSHITDSFVPDQTSSSYKRPTMEMNIASGCPLFARLEHLTGQDTGYLVNDTLFLKITVDTTNISDPANQA